MISIIRAKIERKGKAKAIDLAFRVRILNNINIVTIRKKIDNPYYWAYINNRLICVFFVDAFNNAHLTTKSINEDKNNLVLNCFSEIRDII